MTTLEHAMVGANLVLASGLNRRFGWQLVAVAGVCAVLPDRIVCADQDRRLRWAFIFNEIA